MNTGNKVDPCYHAMAADKAAMVNKKRICSWSNGSSSESDEEKPRVPPPSKRQKTADERKPRKFAQRSTRDGCYPTCISRDHHNQQWTDREEDLEAFEGFVDHSLIPHDDLACTADGKTIRQAYKEYCQLNPNARVLSPNVLGFCCAVRFCKTNTGHIALYHGVSMS